MSFAASVRRATRECGQTHFGIDGSSAQSDGTAGVRRADRAEDIYPGHPHPRHLYIGAFVQWLE